MLLTWVGRELSKLAKLHASLGRNRTIRIYMCCGLDFHHAGLLAGSQPLLVFRGELVVDLRDELPRTICSIQTSDIHIYMLYIYIYM